MNIEVTKSFLKDIEKITDKSIKAEIKDIVLSISKAEVIENIPKLRKLVGYKKGIFYRIKVRDYRIGATIEGDLITLVRCMNRKDIYKFFP